LGHEIVDKNSSADGLGDEIVDKRSSADGFGHEILDKTRPFSYPSAGAHFRMQVLAAAVASAVAVFVSKCLWLFSYPSACGRFFIQVPVAVFVSKCQ
jgi:hypothetical protein